jgi:hypothetical protein
MVFSWTSNPQVAGSSPAGRASGASLLVRVYDNPPGASDQRPRQNLTQICHTRAVVGGLTFVTESGGDGKDGTVVGLSPAVGAPLWPALKSTTRPGAIGFVSASVAVSMSAID